MPGLANRLPLNFDSLGLTLNRIEVLFSEILGSATAARIMLSAPASPTTLFRVASGGIAQERALISAPTSLAALLEALSVVFSEAFSGAIDDLGLNTGNTSAEYAFSEVFLDARDAWAFNLGLPGLLISGNSDVEDVTPEAADGCSDWACGIAGFWAWTPSWKKVVIHAIPKVLLKEERIRSILLLVRGWRPTSNQRSPQCWSDTFRLDSILPMTEFHC
jgi:hypothetical protein